MFPSPKEVLQAREGVLAQVPLPLLLRALLAEGRSCLLELKVRQLEKRLLFEEGSPVQCTSNLLHEQLGRFLVERGKLTEAQAQQALNESVTADVPVGELLVQKQWIAPFDLYKQMQANLAHKILDCFRWVDARYRLLTDAESSKSPIRMNTLQLIYMGCATAWPFEAVTQHLSFGSDQRFGFAASPPHELADLKLSAKDARLVQALRARPTFPELVERGGFDTEQAMRRLYALCVVGFCELSRAPAPEPARPPAPALAPTASPPGPPLATPAAPLPAPPVLTGPVAPTGAVLPEEDDALRNALTGLFLEHRKKDPFDLLGVTEEDPNPLALRKAFLALADRFSPLRFRSTDLKEKAEALLAAFARAYGALSEPEQLALHRKRREIAREAQKKQSAGRPSAAEVFKIRTELLDASTQFEEGKRRLEAGAFRAAVEYFEFAFDIEPRAKHRAFLAWSRYKLSPHAHGKLALHELTEAAKAEPDCELALAFAGDIQRELGLHEQAEESYRRAFKVNPANRRYPELIRDLSRMKKR